MAVAGAVLRRVAGEAAVTALRRADGTVAVGMVLRQEAGMGAAGVRPAAGMEATEATGTTTGTDDDLWWAWPASMSGQMRGVKTLA